MISDSEVGTTTAFVIVSHRTVSYHEYIKYLLFRKPTAAPWIINHRSLSDPRGMHMVAAACLSRQATIHINSLMDHPPPPSAGSLTTSTVFTTVFTTFELLPCLTVVLFLCYRSVQWQSWRCLFRWTVHHIALLNWSLCPCLIGT